MDLSSIEDSTAITGVDFSDESESKSPSHDIPNADLTNAQLGSLRITKKLGAGGMGDVWLGFDESLDIEVAIKVMHQRLASNQKYVRRFMREARSVARLDHPNIVRVYQVKREEYRGNFLRMMVMEYIDGLDAYRARRRESGRKFPPVRAAEICLAVARALAYSHQRGVIHRDIKPANVLIANATGEVKVLDFGLAKKLADEEHQSIYSTRPGVLLGTPQYMGPEQIRREEVDGRADIYSLGISLYEMVSGRLPFRGDTHIEVIRAHRDKMILFPNEHFEDVPATLIKTIKGMCEKNLDDRWSLRRVCRELEVFLGMTPQEYEERGERIPLKELTNIESTTSSMIGNEARLKEAFGLLRSKEVRLLTLIGTGGVGKTALAKDLAREILGLRARDELNRPRLKRSTKIDPKKLLAPGGVWFVDLADAYTEDGVCLAIAQAISETLNQTNTLGELANAIDMRDEILLILDNCEQVLEPVTSVINGLLDATNKLRVIATSRQPLESEGETTLRVLPFDIRDLNEESNAIKLFVERAQSARRDFALSDQNREEIKEIVRALDGIPLAIELAAARVSALTPKKILDRLPQRLDILRTRRRDSAARHSTLRSTIEWSWNLLDPWEKLALIQCSVFRGGFFLDAVEAIVDLSPFPNAPFAIDVIESLYERNLLSLEESDDLVGEERYRLFGGVRDYAEEALLKVISKLGDPNQISPEAEALQRRRAIFLDNALIMRHANFYLRYGATWVTELGGEQNNIAEARMAFEIDNLDAIQKRLVTLAPEKAALAALIAEEILAIRGPRSFRVSNLEAVKEALPDEGGPLRLRILLALTRVHRDLGDDASSEREAMASFDLAKLIASRDASFEQDTLFAQARVEAAV